MSDELPAVAGTYAATILDAVQQEYPNHPRHLMRGPEDRPRPSEIHPAFYGCLDWHSAVEMHWALIRLWRRAPEAIPTDAAAVFDRHLSPDALATEAAYFAEFPFYERPYGWGWALALAEELADWDHPRAAQWSEAFDPLAAAITDGYLRWLPTATYPQRDGAHANSAFGCLRALPWARRRAAAGDRALLTEIDAAAGRWFGADIDAPVRWEPGGADFLSPSLAEAQLMANVLEQTAFTGWLDDFLPGLADPELSIYRPAVVSDATDGQITHLHGLNLYRAHAFADLAGRLGDQPATALMTAARHAHLDASLGAVVGGHWMAEHWLACYAVLALEV